MTVKVFAIDLFICGFRHGLRRSSGEQLRLDDIHFLYHDCNAQTTHAVLTSQHQDCTVGKKENSMLPEPGPCLRGLTTNTGSNLTTSNCLQDGNLRRTAADIRRGFSQEQISNGVYIMRLALKAARYIDIIIACTTGRPDMGQANQMASTCAVPVRMSQYDLIMDD